jgi:hypothetical protein
MRLSRLGAVLAVAGAVALGCADKIPDYPPIQGCTSGPCKSSGAGIGSGAGTGTAGTGGGTTTTGSGGQVALGTLTGSVHRMVDPAFAMMGPTTVTTPATIVIQPASGPQITALYGGSNGTTFTASNVPAGLAWVEVQDQSGGGAMIWNTISPVIMPQIAPIVLPAVDQGTMTNVVSNLPSVQAKGVSTFASHVVLMLQFNGAPYKGLQVTNGAGGAIVIYDTGPGSYSDSNTATGIAGTIILFDSSLTGPATITLTDPTLMKSYMVTVMTATGAVTLASFDLM